MTKVSKSPERNTFQKNKYIERCVADGKEPDADYLKMYEQWDANDQAWADSPKHDNDMEWDLRTTDWILAKVRNSEGYAQNLYAALCNNEFCKNDTWPILAKKNWSCSWRYAGGIIADMQERGDYIDWYCSGMQADVTDEEYNEMTKEQQERYIYMKTHFVSESVITDEIREDLFKLGWIVIDETKE